MGTLRNNKIGCIGAGNMGSAIISRLAGNLKKDDLFCYDTDKSKLLDLKSAAGIKTADSPRDLVNSCDVIIIAVKPDIVNYVLSEIKDTVLKKIIISIAAGISISNINRILKSSQNIIRVMPNTPALIGEGMSVISPGKDAGENAVKIAEEIFSYLGKAIILPEKFMDAVTAVSGSGPAYGFTLIQAMADGGVKMGLPREKAIILAAQTILGAARMVLESKEDPISLRGKVTSPGGTTIDAVHVLERSGFSGIIMDAVEAAGNKSEKMGNLRDFQE